MKKRTVRNIRRVARAVRSGFGAPRLSPYGFGQAFGIVSAIALLFYAVMFWLGDFDPSIIISQYPVSFSFEDFTIVMGLVETYVLGYIGGWIFARIYNKFAR